MPRIDIDLSQEQADALERLREQFGMESIDQVAEYLAKREIRRSVNKITGRNRAIYLVGGTSS